MSSSDVHIRVAQPEHVEAMVCLSRRKRVAYAKLQPLFWKEAEDSDEVQRAWFLELLERDNVLSHVAVYSKTSEVMGFIIGSIMDAPPVYDPGGKTLMVDDFCVSHSELWKTVGSDLLVSLQKQAVKRGAIQALVVCGDHDEPKKACLEDSGLVTASRWYVSGKKIS